MYSSSMIRLQRGRDNIKCCQIIMSPIRNNGGECIVGDKGCTKISSFTYKETRDNNLSYFMNLCKSCYDNLQYNYSIYFIYPIHPSIMAEKVYSVLDENEYLHKEMIIIVCSYVYDETKRYLYE